jgi:hypothetical protein
MRLLRVSCSISHTGENFDAVQHHIAAASLQHIQSLPRCIGSGVNRNCLRHNSVATEPNASSVIRENLNGDRTTACSAYISRPRQRPAANQNPKTRSNAGADAPIANGVRDTRSGFRLYASAVRRTIEGFWFHFSPSSETGIQRCVWR